MNAIRLILTISAVFALFAVGNAQWTQISYEYHITTGAADAGTPFTVETGGYYQWEFKVANWHVVTGDSTQEPRWAMSFSYLCDNNWEFDQVFNAWLDEGDDVFNYEAFEARWGHQTFTRENPTESARRDMGTDAQTPGSHVTDHCYYTIT